MPRLVCRAAKRSYGPCLRRHARELLQCLSHSRAPPFLRVLLMAIDGNNRCAPPFSGRSAGGGAWTAETAFTLLYRSRQLRLSCYFDRGRPWRVGTGKELKWNQVPIVLSCLVGYGLPCIFVLQSVSSLQNSDGNNMVCRSIWAQMEPGTQSTLFLVISLLSVLWFNPQELILSMPLRCSTVIEAVSSQFLFRTPWSFGCVCSLFQIDLVLISFLYARTIFYEWLIGLFLQWLNSLVISVLCSWSA